MEASKLLLSFEDGGNSVDNGTSDFVESAGGGGAGGGGGPLDGGGGGGGGPLVLKFTYDEE